MAYAHSSKGHPIPVYRDETTGQIDVPIVPTVSQHAASKDYVDRGPAQVSVTAPGAVLPNPGLVRLALNNTGDVITLADGLIGVELTMVVVSESAGADTAVVTPANFLGFTTATLGGIGNAATFVMTTGGWVYKGGSATLA